MKHLLFALVLVCSSCRVVKVDWSDSHWGELHEPTYLYSHPDKRSIVTKRLDAGSIIYFHKSHDEYHSVYLVYAKGMLDYELSKQKRYYVYKPNYWEVEGRSDDAVVNELDLLYGAEVEKDDEGNCFFVDGDDLRVFVYGGYCD